MNADIKKANKTKSNFDDRISTSQVPDWNMAGT